MLLQFQMFSTMYQDQKMLITTSAATACQCPWNASRCQVAEWRMESSLLPVALPRGVAMGPLLLQAIQVWMPTL